MQFLHLFRFFFAQWKLPVVCRKCKIFLWPSIILSILPLNGGSIVKMRLSCTDVADLFNKLFFLAE